MKRLNHPDLGLWSAASDDDGELGQSVDLILRQGVELLAGHDRTLWVIVSKNRHSLGDGRGRRRVITCQHSSSDASLSRFEDSSPTFGSRGIIDSSETEEAEALFQLVSWDVFDRFGRLVDDFAREAQHSQTLGCQLESGTSCYER